MSVKLYGTVNKRTADVLFKNMHFPKRMFNPETGNIFLSLHYYDKNVFSINDFLHQTTACLAKAGSPYALICKEIDNALIDYYVVTKDGNEYIDLDAHIEKMRKDKENDLMAEARATQEMAPA